METLIEENLVRSTDFYGPTFELLTYLFACICFHYEHDSGREKDIHKYAVIGYPWLSTNYTPYATGIPRRAMLMAEIEVLKA